MTPVWVAENGCLPERRDRLLARARSPAARSTSCRAAGAIAVIDQAVDVRGVGPGELTLGSDNGTAFTSRAFRARLAELGVTHDDQAMQKFAYGVLGKETYERLPEERKQQARENLNTLRAQLIGAGFRH